MKFHSTVFSMIVFLIHSLISSFCPSCLCCVPPSFISFCPFLFPPLCLSFLPLFSWHSLNCSSFPSSSRYFCVLTLFFAFFSSFPLIVLTCTIFLLSSVVTSLSLPPFLSCVHPSFLSLDVHSGCLFSELRWWSTETIWGHCNKNGGNHNCKHKVDASSHPNALNTVTIIHFFFTLSVWLTKFRGITLLL